MPLDTLRRIVIRAPTWQQVVQRGRQVVGGGKTMLALSLMLGPEQAYKEIREAHRKGKVWWE